jgi:hypothetical protein
MVTKKRQGSLAWQLISGLESNLRDASGVLKLHEDESESAIMAPRDRRSIEGV